MPISLGDPAEAFDPAQWHASPRVAERGGVVLAQGDPLVETFALESWISLVVGRTLFVGPDCLLCHDDKASTTNGVGGATLSTCSTSSAR